VAYQSIQLHNYLYPLILPFWAANRSPTTTVHQPSPNQHYSPLKLSSTPTWVLPTASHLPPAQSQYSLNPRPLLPSPSLSLFSPCRHRRSSPRG